MTTSPNFGPDDPHGLSSRESAILHEIERGLSAADPALARSMARQVSDLGRRSAPMSIKHGVLIVVALLALIVLGSLLPASGWVVLGLLAILIVVPWILLSAIERQDKN